MLHKLRRIESISIYIYMCVYVEIYTYLIIFIYIYNMFVICMYITVYIYIYIFYYILMYWNHKHSTVLSDPNKRESCLGPQTNSRISNEFNLCVSPFASFTIHLHCFHCTYLLGQKHREIAPRQQISDSFPTGVQTKSV